MQPKISVIIAAYNEEKLLARCLTALQNQSYPKEQFEIILIDNGSQDATASIGKKFNVSVYTYKDIQGCGPSRQFGATKANGEIFAFTDPDCIVPPDWLERIESLLKDEKVVMIGGKGIADQKSFLTNIAFTVADGFYLVNHAFKKPLVWGYNMAIKKSAYESVGGINTTLLSSDDWDLAFRLQKKFGKGSVQYVRDLQVQTNPRKQNNPKVLYTYTKDGIQNYFDYVILGKSKAVPVFNVR